MLVPKGPGFFAALLLFLGVVGCGAPPPSEVSEAELQAIRTIVDDFDIAVNAGDYEALAELYDEDAIRMPAEAPPQIGRAAIREWFQLEAERREIEIDNVVRDAQIFGDWGYMWGDATGLSTPRDGGDAVVISSKWMSVVRRQEDGSWKTYRDIYNSNMRPSTMDGGES